MKQFKSRLGAVALALVVIVSAFAISLPVSAQESNATDIDSCTVIDEAGTYVLTQDITDSDEDVCIRVVGDIDGVTIDGNGHTIDGVDNIDGALDNFGVLLDGEDDNIEDSANPRDVTIRGLTLTDWEIGIGFGYATGTVTDVQATSNGYGLRLYESSADISDSAFSDNGRDGIWVDQASAEITNVTTNDNGNAGIFGFDALIDVRDSTVTGNRVGIEDEESRISVTDCVIADNDVRNEYSTDGDSNDGDAGDGDGSDSDTGGATEIDSCATITEPGTYVLTQDIMDSDAGTCILIEGGIDGVTIDGDGHTIGGVDAEDSAGIFAGDSSDDVRDITVENVVLTDWDRGIDYFEVADSSIRDTTIESNRQGIYLETSTDIAITNSTISENDDGVVLLQSFRIELANNVVTENGEGVVTVGGSAMVDDTVASNDVDYRSLAQVEGSPRNTVENFTLDSATISFVDAIDFADPSGSGERLELSAVESAPADLDGFANVGGYVEATADAATAGSLTLSVHYDDTDVPETVDESSLALYQLVDGEWTEVPGSAVDTDANTVSAEFDDPAAFGDGTVLAPFGQADGNAGDGDDTNGDNGADDGDDKSDDKNGDDGSAGDGDSDIVDIGSKAIVIDLGDVTIADFDLRGPGLTNEHIDERTYSVGDFDVKIDGFDLTIDDTHYRFCHVTIDVEPFDVILEDVTLGDGE